MSATKTTFAQGQLKSIVERIERLEAEKAAIGSDIKEVYAEAKGNGYDTKVLRKVIALRKMDSDQRDEFEALIDVYLSALSMAVTTDERSSGGLTTIADIVKKATEVAEEETKATETVAEASPDADATAAGGADDHTAPPAAIAANEVQEGASQDVRGRPPEKETDDAAPPLTDASADAAALNGELSGPAQTIPDDDLTIPDFLDRRGLAQAVNLMGAG